MQNWIPRHFEAIDLNQSLFESMIAISYLIYVVGATPKTDLQQFKASRLYWMVTLENLWKIILRNIYLNYNSWGPTVISSAYLKTATNELVFLHFFRRLVQIRTVTTFFFIYMRACSISSVLEEIFAHPFFIDILKCINPTIKTKQIYVQSPKKNWTDSKDKRHTYNSCLIYIHN